MLIRIQADTHTQAQGKANKKNKKTTAHPNINGK